MISPEFQFFPPFGPLFRHFLLEAWPEKGHVFANFNFPLPLINFVSIGEQLKSGMVEQAHAKPDTWSHKPMGKFNSHLPVRL